MSGEIPKARRILDGLQDKLENLGGVAVDDLKKAIEELVDLSKDAQALFESCVDELQTEMNEGEDAREALLRENAELEDKAAKHEWVMEVLERGGLDENAITMAENKLRLGSARVVLVDPWT